MSIKSWTRRVLKSFHSVTEVVAWIGYIMVAGIVLIVFVDVCGRYLLNSPLLGAYEFVEQGMTILSGFAIMYATVKGGHVAIDLLLVRFSVRTQTIMQSIFSLLGFGVFAVIAYQVYLLAMHVLKSSEPIAETMTLTHIDVAPFLLLLAAGTLLSSLMFLLQAFHPGVSEETTRKEWEGVNEL